MYRTRSTTEDPCRPEIYTLAVCVKENTWRTTTVADTNWYGQNAYTTFATSFD